jgi:hypothetical protein
MPTLPFAISLLTKLQQKGTRTTPSALKDCFEEKKYDEKI